MELDKKIDNIIIKEKKHPTFSHHNINSYLTNLPINKTNTELMNILHYFKSEDNYLNLYQNKEFKNGLKIEVKCEMINDEDLSNNINYRESLYHNHDFFEIIYVYKGYCETIINNTKKVINSNQICLFNLQAIHKLIIPNEQTVVFNILIGKELLTETFLNLFKNTNFVSSFYINSIYNISTSNGNIVISLEDDAQFYLNHLILEFVNKKNFYINIMQSDFISLLLCITRYFEKSTNTFSRKNLGIEAEKVLDYIYKNYNHLNLNDLSNHFGYSPRTMMRYIKKNFDCNFSQLIKECKLNYARDYLLNSNYTVDEIAEKIGFYDRSHFDKVFKNQYNITPKNYRERYKNKQ